MTQKIGTFDFRKLNVIFGVDNISGFADGDSVTVEETDDAFKETYGADGFVDRIKNNANGLMVTLSLSQSSPSNDVLSALHLADRAASTPLPLFIKDRNGNTLISCDQCWITKFPTAAFGNESKTRDWVIKTSGNYVINIGGNK